MFICGQLFYDSSDIAFLPIYQIQPRMLKTIVHSAGLCWLLFDFRDIWMEGGGVTQIFSSLQKLPVPLHAAGVVRTLICCAFPIDNSIILSTTVSLFGPY